MCANEGFLCGIGCCRGRNSICLCRFREDQGEVG